jgi:hypothetical protein
MEQQDAERGTEDDAHQSGRRLEEGQHEEPDGLDRPPRHRHHRVPVPDNGPVDASIISFDNWPDVGGPSLGARNHDRAAAVVVTLNLLTDALTINRLAACDTTPVPEGETDYRQPKQRRIRVLAC